MSDDSNRRAHPRYEVLAQVTVRNGSVDHLLSVLNLSRGGALVDLGSEPRPRWLELRRPVEIRVLTGDGNQALEARGTVVRISESEHTRTFAVQFDAPADEAHVRGILSVAGRPPPLPER